jgi:hypothetical protein
VVIPSGYIKDDALGRAALRIAKGEAGEADMFRNRELREIGK